MAAPIMINHRRNRQQTRRVLAEIKLSCRNLDVSFLREGYGFFDRLPCNDNRIDELADGAERLRQ